MLIANGTQPISVYNIILDYVYQTKEIKVHRPDNTAALTGRPEEDTSSPSPALDVTPSSPPSFRKRLPSALNYTNGNIASIIFLVYIPIGIQLIVLGAYLCSTI